MLALLDGDIFCYRVAAASQDVSEAVAKARLDEMLEDMLLYDLPDVKDYEGYLTGKDNFRYARATIQPYKGNRTQPKPENLQCLRDHAVNDWGFTVIDGEEADDAMGKNQTDDTIIVTIDKDLDQIEGKHFNFVKRLYYDVSKEQATRFFYKQLLTGDRTDNIRGVVGIGDKKAEKILNECKDEHDMYDACLVAYGGNYDELKENADLLWIRRKGQEEWTVPK